MLKSQRCRTAWAWLLILGCALPLVLRLVTIQAQPPHPQHSQEQEHSSRRPLRITMDEMHRSGGVPPGWQFTLPEGDPVAGREVFMMAQCYTCHTIASEQFPPVKPTERAPAPDLTGIGVLHPVAYIVESILNPSAVVVDAPGYADANGFSNMPDYTDALTVRQLLDLVAYLQSLRAPEGQPPHGSGGHMQPPPPAHQQHSAPGHTPPPPVKQ